TAGSLAQLVTNVTNIHLCDRSRKQIGTVPSSCTAFPPQFVLSVSHCVQTPAPLARHEPPQYGGHLPIETPMQRHRRATTFSTGVECDFCLLRRSSCLVLETAWPNKHSTPLMAVAPKPAPAQARPRSSTSIQRATPT